MFHFYSYILFYDITTLATTTTIIINIIIIIIITTTTTTTKNTTYNAVLLPRSCTKMKSPIFYNIL